MSRPKTPIPEELLALRAQLAEWRDTHAPRSPLPEDLWQEATALAARHGVHRTARILPVDYGHLNKRVNGPNNKATATVRRKALLAPSVAFVDLLPRPQQQPGVIVELMKIKANGPLNWAELLTAWQQPKP